MESRTEPSEPPSDESNDSDESPPMSHFFLMVLYASLLSVFFSVLWRRALREQAKLFLQLFLGMVGGGLLVAWLMYPFPSGPPTPFP